MARAAIANGFAAAALGLVLLKAGGDEQFAIVSGWIDVRYSAWTLIITDLWPKSVPAQRPTTAARGGLWPPNWMV